MNYRNYILLFIFIVLCAGLFKAYSDWQISSALTEQIRALYVDFDESMNKKEFQHTLDEQPIAYDFYCFLRSLYKCHNPALVGAQAHPKIPKIIHQIWLGSPLPEEFEPYQQTWKQMHPDWEYKLWTDQDVQKMNLDNQDLYDAAINYGQKSDILRYELLYRYGGVYVDVDYECLKQLDVFNHCYDMYVGIQPLDTGTMQLGIGLIGSIAGHPLLKACINALRKSTETAVVLRTGPIFFSKIFWNFDHDDVTINVALPASYFYPKGYKQQTEMPEVWQRSESCAVHHWAGSWLKPSAFVTSK